MGTFIPGGTSLVQQMAIMSMLPKLALLQNKSFKQMDFPGQNHNKHQSPDATTWRYNPIHTDTQPHRSTCPFWLWERAVCPASQIRWNGFNKPIHFIPIWIPFFQSHFSATSKQYLVSQLWLYTEETVLEQQTSIKEVMKMKLNRHSTDATQLRATLPSNL